MPRRGDTCDLVCDPLQLNPGDRQSGIGEVKKAKFEPAGVFAVDAVFGRHLEDQRCAARVQLGGGEIAPGPLKPVQHDDLDPEHRLGRHAHRANLAAEAQPIRAHRQMQVGTVQDAASRVVAADPHRTVRLTHPDRRILEPRQQGPTLAHRRAQLGRGAGLCGRRAGQIGHHRHHSGNPTSGSVRELPARGRNLTPLRLDCSVRCGISAI